VREGKPGSHKKEWKCFIDAVIQVVTRESSPAFLLWGGKAQDEQDLITGITGSNHRIIKSSHPSPISAHRSCRDSPPFANSKPFTKASRLVREAAKDDIDWSLPPCT
jgi:uracil-DNA glycosylase